MKLSNRQHQVLEFVRACIERGASPTRAEVAARFGWGSANTAELHLRALERKGAIVMVKGVSRGIRLPLKDGESRAVAILSELRAVRDSQPVGDVRSTLSEACDKLDTALSKLASV